MPSISNYLPLTASNFIKEAQCGKLGFTIVTVNMVAMAIFAGNLALGGVLTGAVSLAAAAVILPSIALFGPVNYFSYLPHPLRMGLGFAAAWASVTVKPNGAWEGKFADLAHFNDHRLAGGLENFFRGHNITTAMDCGCGTGFYVKHLRDEGFATFGCDGNPNTQGEGLFVADLSKPKFLQETNFKDRRFDCVLSLEVAEHLPKKHEEAFLTNLTSIAKPTGWIILSWAKVGQGGLGHVNEQNEEYVLKTMAEKGWTCNRKETDKLRLQTSPNTFWFRETIYVFERYSRE